MSLQNSLLFESKIARMAHVFSVNYPSVIAFTAEFFIVDSSIQGLDFLNTFSTNWRLKIKTGKKSGLALEASKTVQLVRRSPTPRYVQRDTALIPLWSF